MKKQKTRKIWLAMLAAPLVIAGFFTVLIFVLNGDLRLKFFELLNLPAAFVGGRAVSFADYELAKKAISQNKGGEAALPLEAAIENLKYQILADKLKGEAFPLEAGQKIEGFSDSESKKIIQANYARNYVAFWYYSQKNLNAESYSKAENLAQRAKSGESMEVLARNYSEEDFSRYFSGEAGQIRIADILPEIAGRLSSMQPGEVGVIPSRHGLHVVKLENRNENFYELKQIFVSGLGFEKWEAAVLAELKPRKILRID